MVNTLAMSQVGHSYNMQINNISDGNQSLMPKPTPL
jgi:hypothetical protein